MFRQVRESIGTIWCTLAHDSLMWPVHGHYDCRTCGRRYPAFADASTEGSPKQTASSGAAPRRARSAQPSLNRA